MTYRDEVEALLDELATKGATEERIQAWVEVLAELKFSEGEVHDLVFDSLVKRMGRREAADFAERVRRRFIWRNGARVQ